MLQQIQSHNLNSMPNCRKLVVGDRDWGYEDIIRNVSESSTSQVFWNKFTDLMAALEISSAQVQYIKSGLTTTVTYESALRTTLNEWRSKKSTEASLFKLLETFRRIQLNDCAHTLHHQFCKLTCIENGTQTPHSNIPQSSRSSYSGEVAGGASGTRIVNGDMVIYKAVESPELSIDQSNLPPVMPTCTSRLSQETVPGSPPLAEDDFQNVSGNSYQEVVPESQPMVSSPAVPRTCNKNRIKIATITGLLLLLIIIISIIAVFVVRHYKQTNESAAFKTDVLTNHIEHHIHVDSQWEYMSKMSKISININDRVILHISLSNPNLWTDDFVMTKVATVREIYFESAITINAIFSILRQSSKNLEILNFISDSHETGLCSYTNEELSNLTKKFSLENLKKIDFGGSSCSKIFKNFANFIHTPNLKEFIFNFNSDVFGAGELVSTLLHNSKTTLSTLEIYGEHINDILAIFNLHLPILINVENVTLSTKSPFRSNLFDKKLISFFNRVFPQVKYLNLDNFIVKFSLFVQLLEIESLVQLQIGVHIATGSFPVGSVPSRIKTLILFLSFEICNNSKPSLSGIGSPNTKFSIASNCPISADTPLHFFYGQNK